VTATKQAITLEELRERPVVDVPTAGAALGMSRSASYRAAERGYLPTIRLGDRRVVVPVARLLALLEGEGTTDAA
jgi:predicted DNA-binding transcriptional regulator AlpA